MGLRIKLEGRASDERCGEIDFADYLTLGHAYQSLPESESIALARLANSRGFFDETTH